MPTIRLHRALSADARARVVAFLDAMALLDGRRMNDHLVADLRAPRSGFVAATIDEGGSLTGYAQATATHDGFLVDAVAADPAQRRALLTSLLAELPAESALTWWATDADADTAAALHLRTDRRLLNLHTELPVAATTDVSVRAFRPGVDDDAWLAVNNAAFAWHGEQGGWDVARLQQRLAEPWFSAAGFLLHERDGRLAAFCWTKLHPGEPVVGEIYVIAVHPDFHGSGLGRALTVAGLQHLNAAGATHAMLYVDADNTAAVRLYEQLGFTTHHADQSYRRDGQTFASEEPQ